MPLEASSPHGPDWLCKDISSWPAQLNSYEEKNLPEAKQKVSLTAVTIHSRTTWDLMSEYSSLTQLLIITGWVILACDRFKLKGKTHHEPTLTVDLISRARLFWIKETQRVHLHSELIMLKKSQVPRNHVLNRLTVCIESSRIIRVGGRLYKT